MCLDTRNLVPTISCLMAPTEFQIMNDDFMLDVSDVLKHNAKNIYQMCTFGMH